MGAAKKPKTRAKTASSRPLRSPPPAVAKSSRKAASAPARNPVSERKLKSAAPRVAQPEPKAKTRGEAPLSRVERLPPSAPEAREGISPVAAKALPPEPALSGPDGTRGKYVYCVIHAEKALSFGPLGIGQEPADVHTVNYKD